MTVYHASVALGHFARVLQARTQRNRHSTLVLLQALWLVSDPLADAPVVRIDFGDVSDVVTSAVRLRQIITELVDIGALERVDTTSRRYRLRKPAVESLDASARARLTLLQAELERVQRLVATPVANASTAATKDERANSLVRLGKKPSDIRDALAHMADVAPGSLRYSGAGSGPVQAAVGWLARGATWAQFIGVCQYVQQDRDRPASDLVWLFGDQHRGYLQHVVNTLSDSVSTPAPSLVAAPSSADEQRELVEQVAALLGSDAETVLPSVVQARQSGVFVHEILDETRIFAAGGPRPDWLPA